MKKKPDQQHAFVYSAGIEIPFRILTRDPEILESHIGVNSILREHFDAVEVAGAEDLVAK